MSDDLRLERYPFMVRPLAEDEGGGYLIEYPDIPGCITDGETIEETIANGRDALRSILLTMVEFGDPIPEPGTPRPLSGSAIADINSRLEDIRKLVSGGDRS